MLTDYDMVLMVEEGIRGGICHAMKRYAKANNKYMKDYGRKKKSSYIQYLDANNLYGKAMTKNYNKAKTIACNLNDKKNYIVHINVLKQALDHGLKLRKVHRVIEFDQEAWLKEYIDVNTELRKKATNDFEKNFFKLMNNAVFGKTMENVRKYRDIKLVKTDKKTE